MLPCYNEQEIIAETVRSAADCIASWGGNGEVIVVNDGSTDGTAEVLRTLERSCPFLVVVTHGVNRGYGSAIRSGCDVATKDAIAFMDSDGQFKVEDMEKLLVHLDRFPVASGIRGKRSDPPIRSLNSRLYRLLVNVVFGLRVIDLECGMKVFRRSAWPLIRPEYATGASFDAELFFNMKKNRISFCEANVNHYPRTFGRPTGANLKVIFRAFRDLFFVLCRRDNLRWLFFPVFRGTKV